MTEALARSTDPETSHAAAALVNVNHMEFCVLMVLSKNIIIGLTCSEVAVKANYPRDSISPRMKGLVAKKYVEASKEKRVPFLPNPDGRRQPKQIVWQITELGRKYLQSRKE